MHTNRVYTIFWKPSLLPTGVDSFQASPGYEDTVNAYFERVAHDSHKFSDAYSVATQYYSGANNHIEYASSFGGSAMDSNPFPASECKDEQPEAGESIKLKVCLTTQQLEEQIASVVEAQGWTVGSESIFFLYTPEGVGSCFAAGEEASKGGECAYTYYCAYHDNFTPHSEEVIWANMPYEQTETCDDGAEPEGSDAGPAIDATSHEHNEAISDPTGTSWWDSEGGSEEVNPDYGEEMADLCDFAEASLTYGSLLEGSTGYDTPAAFNQAIDGHHYLLQQEWSDAAGAPVAGKTPGACAQLLLPAVFTPRADASANAPTQFDGSASGIPGEDPVARYSWEFGDGASGVGEAPVHTYASPGEYIVTLTVEDARGNTNTRSEQVDVAAEVTTTTTSTTTSSTPSTTTTTTTSSTPSSTITTTTSSTPSTSTTTTTSATPSTTTTASAPSSTSTTTTGSTTTVASATTTTTTTSTATAATATSTTSTSTTSTAVLHPPAPRSATFDLANAATLPADTSAFPLGRASCVSSCTVAADLYARVQSSGRHHRVSRRELVGSAQVAISSGATARIVARLNAAGRHLLARGSRLVVQLTITAFTPARETYTQEMRTLTLTVARHLAHRRRT